MSAPITRVPPIRPLTAPTFHGAGLTHAGLVRDRNEDSILTDPSGALWAVADGMGGYGHGDVASDIVIDRLSLVTEDGLAAQALRARLAEANHEIIARVRAPGMDQMGSTVVAALIQNSVATIAWAGDCRAYLMRGGALRLLTRDHTVVQEMVEQGLLHARDRDHHPESHVVTRAIGFEPDVEIDTVMVPLVPGDRLMLCSDGLTACLSDQEIAGHMDQGTTPQDMCKGMVIAALDAGAPDNVSVVAVFATGP
jgi:protein phosphatase